ncbi:glycosyltransferase [Leptothoe sp. PORK10 BA2]|uniref:glycosyltransferase n=1 Tax=Leptothoe sp. PORK10 BA2 TaxID=3110254 RepID=UPI002B1FEA8D|nr:glycosyltransferase family 2 protein [Leptothoe sp. PORK10 BA2]MEA5466109.1 glycosyltransferase family 2 protein [Leptothoe sp. PORK10 BA2]
MSSPPPFVSVIIPVYNDYDRLKKCLEILDNQTYPKQSYEIIVVDNNSTDDIKSLIEKFEQTKYEFESVPGSYSARNKGLSIAQGEILGFTDSDCTPATNWIEKGVVNILKNPGCGLVAGCINFAFQDPENPHPAELYDSLYFLQQEKYIEEDHFGATANVFTTRKIFDVVGLFNATLKSGGDREWGERVYAAGYELIYAADVEISHPARASFQELNKKLHRVFKGSFYINKKAEIPIFDLLQELTFDIKPPARFLFRALKERGINNRKKCMSVVILYMLLKVSKAITELQLYWQENWKLQSTG